MYISVFLLNLDFELLVEELKVIFFFFFGIPHAEPNDD